MESKEKSTELCKTTPVRITSLDTNKGNILLPRPEIYIGSEPPGTVRVLALRVTDALSEDESEARVDAEVRFLYLPTLDVLID